METKYPFKDYKTPAKSEDEMKKDAAHFLSMMEKRRSVRFFADRQVPLEIIKDIVATANTAPSGANMQPWKFCVVSNPMLKKKIRKAAEEEEYLSYTQRMSEEWLEDLAPLDTNWEKPFLEIAPYLIIMTKETYGLQPDGNKKKHYYVSESVGIAAGFLIAAIQNAGLVTLTHTPSPMNFLTELLGRPLNEKAYLLLPVGYPADDCKVPVLEKKSLDEVFVEYF